MLRVAFAGSFAASLEPQVRARLSNACDILVSDETDIVARMQGIDVLVSLAFTRDMGAAARRLKLLQVPGAGLDRVDRSALPAETWLANAYGHDVGIAEYVMGAMLATSRSFCRLDARLREGVWESQWATATPPPAPWPELAGKTLCILGYGHIGRELARRARAFDMDVRALRRDVSRGADGSLNFLGGPESLPDLLARADFLAVTLSLNPTTRGLIGARELGLMKASAILINVARAEIIDETALYQALADRRIAGAALDVWYRYPAGPGPVLPARRPFHELPNVLMTPHVSGWTEGMLAARADVIAQNIQRVARGEAPMNLITST